MGLTKIKGDRQLESSISLLIIATDFLNGSKYDRHVYRHSNIHDSNRIKRLRYGI
jgi:hypothetical protein